MNPLEQHTGLRHSHDGMAGRQSREGLVLFAVLAALTALALLAAASAVVIVNDVKMTSQLIHGGDAVNAADAGIQYVKTRIEADLTAGALTLTNPTETVSYAAPAGFRFDPVTQLKQTSNPEAYRFILRGHATDAIEAIEVIVRRRSIFEMGLFGNESVDTKAYGGVYSYSSDTVDNPGPGDSTGDAYIGSNEAFTTHQDTLIDGTFSLGEAADGTDGTWTETPSGGSIVNGEAGLDADRIDPDPLGAGSGALADDFAYYANPSNNNDAAASPPIVAPNYRIRLNNGESITLTSGIYYVTEVTLQNGSTLNIDDSGGPITMYLTGKFEAKEGSAINWTGRPTDFTLYSNSSDSIILKHNGDFKGVIYAPFADVQIRNSASFYGLAWANALDIKNSGEIYMDVAAQKHFLSSSIVFLSWKEIRDY